MSADPQVSVCLPTYNRVQHLKQTIENILTQSYTDFELLVSNDASTDETAAYLATISDPRVKVFSHERNLNIPGNLNYPLNRSKGEYIIFLHDHDNYDRDLLQSCVNSLDANQDLGFTFAQIAWVDYDGSNYRIMEADFEPVNHGLDVIDMVLFSGRFSCPIHALGMIRRRCFEEVGFFFDERFGFLSDVDLWLRIANRFDVGFIPEPLIVCRGREKEHEFAQPDWRVLAWSVGIFQSAIKRSYDNDPEKSRIASIALQKAVRVLSVRIIRAAFLNCDLDTLEASRDALSDYRMPILKLVGTIGYRFPIIPRAISCLVSRARRI